MPPEFPRKQRPQSAVERRGQPELEIERAKQHLQVCPEYPEEFASLEKLYDDVALND